MDKLKIIKVAVFVMTIMLIVGSGALAWGLMRGKTVRPTADSELEIRKDMGMYGPSVKESRRAGAVAFGGYVDEVWLGEESGSEIKDFKPCGENLCILLTDGGKDDRIVVVDMLGKIVLKIFVGEEEGRPSIFEEVSDDEDDE